MQLRNGSRAALITLMLTGSALACDGTVTIGEGTALITSTVPNLAVGNACLNELIIDTRAEGANYGNHGEFVETVAELTHAWVKRRIITKKQAGELVAISAHSAVGKTMHIRVIAFNDFHGNIDGANLNLTSIADGIPARTPAGGVDYMAGLVQQLKSGALNNVVVSAGDLIGASPLNSALFHDEPTIETMNRLGLDFNAVGNHEFDEGRHELLRMQSGGCHPTDVHSCQGAVVGTPVPFEGAKFKFLAANVVDSSSGDTLFPAYGVKSFKGNRVAFIGMTLQGTPSIVTPSGVAGLEFRAEADTANALIKKLKHRHVESVVVLIHEGGVQVSGNSINGCSGISGPLVDIVSHLDDAVDLVVSGHTHQAYNCLLPNSLGRRIPVTSAGSFSRLMTSIDMTIDTKTGDVTAVAATNKLVDRTNVLGATQPITPVTEISSIVAGYNTLVKPIANRVIGSVTADITTTRNSAGESALGDLIADAQLAASAAPGKGGSVVAFMNTGGIRANLNYAGSTAGEGDGNVTYGEAFTVQPFGNNLVVKTLTGQQIYDVLNQQWGLGQSPEGGRTLQISNGFSYSHTFVPNVSPLGVGYVCDGSVMLEGVVINKTANYRVTMNSFLATGGDNFTVFNLGTDQLGGDVDLDAMEAYFSAHSPLAPSQQNRIRKVIACN